MQEPKAVVCAICGEKHETDWHRALNYQVTLLTDRLAQEAIAILDGKSTVDFAGLEQARLCLEALLGPRR